MLDEEITNVLFLPIPDVRIRVIEFGDSELVIASKNEYPFKLHNSITVCVLTTKRHFDFCIHNGFTWNGADIPRFLWRIIGARTDNQFLLCSMVHDFMLDFRFKLMYEVFNGDITIKEYRRLTTLIFREILRQNGTKPVKANIMSFFVDCFQKMNSKWKEGISNG